MNQIAPISAASARLPQTYETAKTALANCAQLDECQDWADKAAALASYAKQANDDEMMKMAVRIRDRAIRRAGELLKQIEPGKTGPKPELRGDAPPQPANRKQAILASRGVMDNFPAGWSTEVGDRDCFFRFGRSMLIVSAGPNLSTPLCGVVLVGETTLGLAFDQQRIGLRAVPDQSAPAVAFT